VAERVLIVEDEAQIVRLVRAYLEQRGYQVIVVRDGEEGLLRYRQEQPNIERISCARSCNE